MFQGRFCYSRRCPLEHRRLSGLSCKEFHRLENRMGLWMLGLRMHFAATTKGVPRLRNAALWPCMLVWNSRQIQCKVSSCREDVSQRPFINDQRHDVCCIVGQMVHREMQSRLLCSE
jgi:hypothetical protein